MKRFKVERLGSLAVGGWEGASIPPPPGSDPGPKGIRVGQRKGCCLQARTPGFPIRGGGDGSSRTWVLCSQ